jgi:tRNA (cmo5U34)-methyltransferase
MGDTKETRTPLEAVGDNIVSETANWKFDGNVARTFGDHVRRSVPLYDMGHELICRLSDFFVNDQSTCYELGCSTGELLYKLAEHNTHKPGCEWIGIDNSPSMVTEAQSRCAAVDSIDVVQDDINLVALKRSDFIVAYYTIQFNRPHLRQPLFDKIFESLNWGGALVMFEKVRGPDARFQDMLNALYDDFKREQGFDDHEIMSKSRSLRGILEPYSSQANIDYLHRAGFSDVMPIMKYLNFEGLLAIK